MQITTKFDVGQAVWRIGRLYTERKEPCPACKGKGSIPVEGWDVPAYCPNAECHRGSVVVSHSQPWRVVDASTVGNVRVSLYDDPARHENEELYMLYSTGVGSGSLWPPDVLFASEAEALAECERRNAVVVATPVEAAS